MTDGPVRRRLRKINTRPFGRPETLFYEWVAAPAVQRIVAPVLVDALAHAPSGLVLDVGCGGGALARDVQPATGRSVVGIDPSTVQVRRARRRARDLTAAVAPADALPFAAGTFAAAFSSCTIKHWPDRGAGLAECARVVQPGGQLVIVEIDSGDDPGDLLRFARHTRIPPGLRWLYPTLAKSTFVPFSPTAEAIAADALAAGFVDIKHWRLQGLPFLVLAADRAR